MGESLRNLNGAILRGTARKILESVNGGLNA
jgi:hypothetical protein